MKKFLKTLGIALAVCGLGGTANAEPWFLTTNDGNGKEVITAYMDQNIPNLIDVDIQPGNVLCTVNGVPHNVSISSGESEVRFALIGGQDIDVVTVTGVDLEAQATQSFVGPNWFKMEFFLQDGDDSFENLSENKSFVDAGKGNDLCIGGPASDAFEGGDGDDDLQGNGDNDLLEGQRGDDDLDGGEGPDVLIGGSGLDVMNGGPGDDSLIGNRIFASGKSSPDHALDQMFGDTGADAFYYRHFKYKWINFGPYAVQTQVTQETDDVLDYMPQEGDTLESLESETITISLWKPSNITSILSSSRKNFKKAAK